EPAPRVRRRGAPVSWLAPGASRAAHHLARMAPAHPRLLDQAGTRGAAVPAWLAAREGPDARLAVSPGRVPAVQLTAALRAPPRCRRRTARRARPAFGRAALQPRRRRARAASAPRARPRPRTSRRRSASDARSRARARLLRRPRDPR